MLVRLREAVSSTSGLSLAVVGRGRSLEVVVRERKQVGRG